MLKRLLCFICLSFIFTYVSYLNEVHAIGVTTSAAPAPVEVVPADDLALFKATGFARRNISGMLGDSKSLDLPAIKRTGQHNLNLPQASVVHPYDPRQEVNVERKWVVEPRFSLNFEVPAIPSVNGYLATIMPDIMPLLEGKNVRVLVVSQNLPWGATPLFFHPHYCIWPDEPFETDYNPYAKGKEVSVGIFAASSPTLGIHGQPTGTMTSYPVSIARANTIDGRVISSSDISIEGIILDGEFSASFWSVVIDGDNAVVTLHWLLNDQQQRILGMVTAMPTICNLNNLLAAMIVRTEFEFSNFSGLTHLQALMGSVAI
jgi:hypothetical protein